MSSLSPDYLSSSPDVISYCNWMSVKTTLNSCVHLCVHACVSAHVLLCMCVCVCAGGGSVPPHFLFPSLSPVFLSPPLLRPKPHQLCRAGLKEGKRTFPSYRSAFAASFNFLFPSLDQDVLVLLNNMEMLTFKVLKYYIFTKFNTKV